MTDVEYEAELYQKVDELKKRKKDHNENAPFVVAFCGVFSSGKSSIINYLLDLKDFSLPVGVNPVTKLVTRISYGPQRKFYYFKDGGKYALSENKFCKIVLGQEKIKIPSNEICIELPAKILKNNVVFLDTPGFEDEMGGELEAMSRKAVLDADFVVFCMCALQLGKMFEKEFIAELEESIGRYALVITRMDSIYTKENERRIREQATYLTSKYPKPNDLYPTGENTFFTIAYGPYATLGGLDSFLGRLVTDFNLKKQIHRLVFKKKMLYLCDVLHQELMTYGEPICNELKNISEKHERIIKRLQIQATANTQKYHQDAARVLDRCRTELYSKLNAVYNEAANLERQEKHIEFVEKITEKLRNVLYQVAGQIDQGLGIYEQSENISGDVFDYIKYYLEIPSPVPHKEKVWGAVGRTVWTLFNIIGGDFTIDDGCETKYYGYADAAKEYIQSNVAPWFLERVEHHISVFYDQKAKKEASEQTFTSGEEEHISQLQDKMDEILLALETLDNLRNSIE